MGCCHPGLARETNPLEHQYSVHFGECYLNKHLQVMYPDKIPTPLPAQSIAPLKNPNLVNQVLHR